MVVVTGTFQDGQVKLDKEYASTHQIKVIVTFLDEVEEKPKNRLLMSDFSFAKSRKILKRLKGSLSDAVIEERRSEL